MRAEIARVVAGARHDLRAEQVGLLLVLAAVLQEHRAEAELAALEMICPQPPPTTAPAMAPAS